MAEEYIKAQDIPGFAEFPEQLQRLLSVPSQEYSSKGFLLQTDSPVYCLSYTTHQYKAKYMFYSEKCLVTLDTSLAPKSIDIDTFKCFGHEKGSGRKLLCYALTWIQKELGLPSQTSVLLQADPTYRNNIKEAVNKASEAKNEGEEERIVAAAMESLKAYYRKYGFKGKGSNMEAKLETILGSCQSGGRRILRRKLKGNSVRFRSDKTRRSQRRKQRKTRRQRGAGVNCYNKEKTWSCSTQCGEDGKCEAYD